MIKPEKLCVFCEHFDWYGPKISSCSTCGSWEGHVSCKLDKADWDVPQNVDDVRKILLTAEKCDGYTRK